MKSMYKVYLADQPAEFLKQLDDKSRRICKKNLKKLQNRPYPGEGIGDKEKLPIQGELRYRLHIGRTWTAFYEIIEEQNRVLVTEILSIDDAHKKYGFQN